MSVKNLISACDVEEQIRRQEEEVRLRTLPHDLTIDFNEKFRKDGMSGAWNFYLTLDSASRGMLRNYRSDNGILDFSAYIQKVQVSRPCGIAYKFEKVKLIDMINAELKTLSRKERTSYLNGKLLTLEL